uniref:Uncharacterized protein n=1 Tax=Anguilla anguilla TaxID=7936 RepID=A0A0E9TS95_ANGAN
MSAGSAPPPSQGSLLSGSQVPYSLYRSLERPFPERRRAESSYYQGYTVNVVTTKTRRQL